MIIDKIENAHLYYNLGKNIKEAFNFLEKTDFSNIEDGMHVINGDEIYANVQTYATKEEKTTPWEIHRTYTDIQFMIDGCEIMGWSNIDNYIPTTDFDTEKDISFGNVNNGNYEFIKVPNKYFIIFTPQDAHKPALQNNSKETVRKVIIKVKM